MDNARGARINFDFYKIPFTTMPTVNGVQLTNDQLISHFRLYINEFSTTGIGGTVFAPISNDIDLWNSTNPLGANIRIHIPINNGNVVVSDFLSCCWVFTTIKGSFNGPGYLPVSGNRQFGISESGGVKYFYIKGADRSTTVFDDLFDPFNFMAANHLWETVVDKFSAFINDNNGASTIVEPTQEPINWQHVKNRLKSLDQITPTTQITCE